MISLHLPDLKSHSDGMMPPGTLFAFFESAARRRAFAQPPAAGVRWPKSRDTAAFATAPHTKAYITGVRGMERSAFLRRLRLSVRLTRRSSLLHVVLRCVGGGLRRFRRDRIRLHVGCSCHFWECLSKAVGKNLPLIDKWGCTPPITTKKRVSAHAL